MGTLKAGNRTYSQFIGHIFSGSEFLDPTVCSHPRRCSGGGYLHFITTSCYQRRPWLGVPHRRDLFLRVLEEARQRYGFVVVGYVVMPEHIHLLIGEPDQGTPSTVMQVLKQRFAREVLRRLRRRSSSSQGELWETALDQAHVWQRRFYDFEVWNPRKRVEKLRYIHRNPVKRGLVLAPEQWRWSSYRSYAYDEAGPVLLNEKKPVVRKWREPSAIAGSSVGIPTPSAGSGQALAKNARVGQPQCGGLKR